MSDTLKNEHFTASKWQIYTHWNRTAICQLAACHITANQKSKKEKPLFTKQLPHSNNNLKQLDICSIKVVLREILCVLMQAHRPREQLLPYLPSKIQAIPLHLQAPLS